MSTGEYGSREYWARIESWITFYRDHLLDDGWVRSFPSEAAQYRNMADYWASQVPRNRLLATLEETTATLVGCFAFLPANTVLAAAFEQERKARAVISGEKG